MNFTIDIEKLLPTIATIEAANADIRLGFDNMKNTVNSKVGSPVWRGVKADAFKRKWEDFADNFDACIAQLETVRSQAEAADRAYKGLDQA